MDTVSKSVGYLLPLWILVACEMMVMPLGELLVARMLFDC